MKPDTEKENKMFLEALSNLYKINMESIEAAVDSINYGGTKEEALAALNKVRSRNGGSRLTMTEIMAAGIA